jgi:hypothetical protein
MSVRHNCLALDGREVAAIGSVVAVSTAFALFWLFASGDAPEGDGGSCREEVFEADGVPPTTSSVPLAPDSSAAGEEEFANATARGNGIPPSIPHRGHGLNMRSDRITTAARLLNTTGAAAAGRSRRTSRYRPAANTRRSVIWTMHHIRATPIAFTASLLLA